MKKVEVIETESRRLLTHQDDGFIVYGAILKPQNLGLFGSSKELEVISRVGIEGKAYTLEEFLDGLCINDSMLRNYCDKRFNKISNGKDWFWG